MLHPVPLRSLTTEHDTLLQMVVAVTFKHPNWSQISNFSCSKNSLPRGHNTSESHLGQRWPCPSHITCLPEAQWTQIALQTLLCDPPREARKISAQNMWDAGRVTRTFSHAFRNTSNPSGSIVKKKKKQIHCWLQEGNSARPSAAGSAPHPKQHSHQRASELRTVAAFLQSQVAPRSLPL